MNGYDLSRNWFDWCFENPEKINPNHTAIYFFAIEHCNRMGWKNKFGFPSQMTMDALGIKKHQTYIKYFRDLVDWGFIILIQESKNQYSANIISLNNAMTKNGKALDKAFIKHTAKQTQSNGQSNSSIDKQTNNKLINNKQEEKIDFDIFYNLYDKKVDGKDSKLKWDKLDLQTQQLILSIVPKYIKSTPDKQFRKSPLVYLNKKAWEDEIIIEKEFNKPVQTYKEPIAKLL